MALDLRAQLKTWGFALVPAIAIFELVAHVVQVRSVIGDESWARAREETRALAKPDDLVIFAPRWADPVGRQVFGDELATLEREAWADVERFPRAIEVSIRGEHAPELSEWKPVATKKVDGITLTTLENPSYRPTITDLLKLVHPPEADVSVRPLQDTAARPCGWGKGSAQSGNLGFGPAIPAEKFTCPGTFAGISVVSDLDYMPHKCIFAPPPGGGQALRIVFHGVTFGESLHGHHGLYVEAERERLRAPVHLGFWVGDSHIAKVTHSDGDGWKSFDLPTPDLAGKTADLTVEITSANADRRIYCFEAITR
ncbi:hypothetical protein LZC95_45705 [Pendulispora brunnea]|uniref:Uncharacterized protein n=1 Tax=Pendulispora brunnea TaxID=2905690 RepID=A0ABZ2K4V2_9BACT